MEQKPNNAGAANARGQNQENKMPNQSNSGNGMTTPIPDDKFARSGTQNQNNQNKPNKEANDESLEEGSGIEGEDMQGQFSQPGNENEEADSEDAEEGSDTEGEESDKGDQSGNTDRSGTSSVNQAQGQASGQNSNARNDKKLRV